MDLPTIPIRALPLLLAACAATPSVKPPSALEPGRGERLAMTVTAHGVQIYECRNSAGTVPQWTFVAPEADLFDAEGRRIGRHGAGPFWQADDGSRVVGQVKAQADAPAAGAIPWLLLATQSTGAPGLFSRVTSIQRIHTTGGLAPSAGCIPERVGTPARIPYTADYRLFVTHQETLK